MLPARGGPYDGKDHEGHHVEDWTLTEAGRAAAAAGLRQIPVDDLFAPPKVTHPERLEQGRNKRHAAKVTKVLTFNQGRIRGRQVMFPGIGASLTAPYASSLRSDIPDAVMKLPHLEAFTDVDDQESLRITEAGIAATATRRSS